MINEYKEKLQKRLTEGMVRERNQVTLHIKDIHEKKREVTDIRQGIEEVDEELGKIKENEGEYLRLQKEYYT